ncbi:Cyclopropane-fatty-acyl-phospholipid synthase [Melia azedarach]|uniref:Cyclopropane-fatty-acyl-phospholipid synthase n=1 Tax=Melia azedarach TaxID=155640 RepID=A0ACC1YJI1_MELAZ|nr:Cyclopropane-fatty-acyl-phospholipid synthase [Melia azedarach]
MTEADIGPAAYINGDFSFVDKDEGLVNLLMILIADRDLDSPVSKLNQKRGWWSPVLFAAGIASAKYFFRHILRQNTITQARRNISSHYDLVKFLSLLMTPGKSRKKSQTKYRHKFLDEHLQKKTLYLLFCVYKAMNFFPCSWTSQ